MPTGSVEKPCLQITRPQGESSVWWPHYSNCGAWTSIISITGGWLEMQNLGPIPDHTGICILWRCSDDSCGHWILRNAVLRVSEWRAIGHCNAGAPNRGAVPVFVIFWKKHLEDQQVRTCCGQAMSTCYSHYRGVHRWLWMERDKPHPTSRLCATYQVREETVAAGRELQCV